MRKPLTVLLTLLALVPAAFASDAPRAETLLQQLTLQEKIDLLGGTGFGTRGVPRLQIPPFRMSDGPVGVRSPAPSMAYAAGIGLAASWDVALAERIGVQLGRDARSRGAHFLLGPGVNIYRAPMNGRNFEYFGEDPFLAARVAVGYIKGVQAQGVSATIKHFVGNNSEFARQISDSIIDERAMREIYLPAFEAAVKEARVGAVMSAYNLVNGSYVTASPYLVRQVLKGDWKFDGVFMSDWGATYDGVAAANAGLDLEMPTPRFMSFQKLEPALRAGAVQRADIDDKVRRQLRLAERFQWFDRPGADPDVPRYNQEGRQVAYESALAGTVLLKNEQGLLPLDAKRVRNVAVIGPTAHPGIATAGGSGHVATFATVSVLQGLSDELKGTASVTYSRGVPSLRVLSLLNRFTTGRENATPGIIAESFANNTFSGQPLATRIERQFSSGSPGFGGDPEFLTILDTLPAAAAQNLLATRESLKSFERWTSWYHAESSGVYTIFVQNLAGFRLRIDDELVLDSSHIARSALTQVKRTLAAGPHKVVFEQTAAAPLGRPFWRVGLVRDGSFVEPLARQIAAKADAVVLAVGFDAESETESADREFELPPGQEELIREIAAINPNTVVVLIAGGSVATANWLGAARALVAAWYPGQEGGAALADLLLGNANPSGRLPISWEKTAEQNPAFAHYYFNDPQAPRRIVYREGVFVGYRGYQRAGVEPLFPFGFGLSYTSFRYGNLRVSAGADPVVSFDVTNTGARAGADVAQIYVSPDAPTVERPPRELKAFARVQLEPGETRSVSVQLNARAFAYYDVKSARWRAEAGAYTVELARSSADIQARAPVSLSRTRTVSVRD